FGSGALRPRCQSTVACEPCSSSSSNTPYVLIQDSAQRLCHGVRSRTAELGSSTITRSGDPDKGKMEETRMQTVRVFAFAAATLAAMTASAWSADPPPGAASCSGCHPATQGVASPVARLNGRDA